MGKFDPMTESEAIVKVAYYEKPEGGTLLNKDHLDEYIGAKSLLRGLELGRSEGDKWKALAGELVKYIEQTLGCVDGHELPEDETIFEPCRKCAYCKAREAGL